MDFEDSLVSVIVPVYNAALFLGDTLESILVQTYKDIEIICVDDASSDNSADILLSYAQSNSLITPILLDSNIGVSGARNIAIKRARGRYLAFLDSDDIWTYDKIEKQIKFMRENELAFSHTTYGIMDEAGKIKNKRIRAKKKVDYKTLLKRNYIPCLTAMIDRKKAGDIEMPKVGHEDYAAWLEILRTRNICSYGIDECLAYYRQRNTSLSSNKIRAAGWTWEILRKREKLGPFSGAYYFLHYIFGNIIKYYI